MKLGSTPEVFIDPVLAGFRPPPKRRKGLHSSPAALNHAKIAKELFERLVHTDGWQQFVLDCGNAKTLSSTPGWEDGQSPPRPTHPGAKPIGDAQWGAAVATVLSILAAVPALQLPKPAPAPDGFICMEWDIENAFFGLQIHAGIMQQTYKWGRVLDGMPREHESTLIDEVICAIREFHRSAMVSM